MNHHPRLLQNLYVTASNKYRKFKFRFDKAIQNGRFYKFNKKKQSSLAHRLKKLYERLKSLHTQLRLAGMGAALATTLASTDLTNAQSPLGPFETNISANPFPPPVVIYRAHPAVVDIDNDGDLDVLVGNYFGDIQFFRNDSPAGSVTLFTEITGSANPFNNINKGDDAAPAFADVDGDGDFDMLLGVFNPTYDPPGGPTEYDYSPTFFFRNTGTPSSPVFTEQTGASNPFDGIYGTKYGPSIPTFVNIDGDSDVDLFIGGSYASDIYGAHPAIEYYQNNAGVFTNTPHPINNTRNFYGATVAFADIDEDGDLDAFVSASAPLFDLVIFCLINDGGTFTESNGNWDPVNKTGNPLEPISDHNHISILTADLDGDTDLDVMVTQGDISSYSVPNSNLKYFENSDGDFTLLDHTDLNVSPFGGVDVGEEAAPVFVDLDDDGDLDVVIGSKYSQTNLHIYINNEGVFTADPDHPISTLLNDFGFTTDVIPAFVDIDNDGDQDLFVCANYFILFFRNISGSFTYDYSPLSSVTSSSFHEVSLAFLDVDGDEDFDALVGNADDPAAVHYFENQGTPSEPDFVEVTAPSPFDTDIFSHGNIPEESPNVVAVNFDNDADVDLVVSETFRSGDESLQTMVLFFENNNDGTFTELTSSPIEMEIGRYGYINFLDLDNDGDLDAFAGTHEGQMEFLENTNPPPLTSVAVQPLTVVGGQPTIVDPSLTIVDPDGDDITQATVTIDDFVVGEEELDFTLQSGIEGNFDSGTGILTFIGKAPLETYQNLLRSVTFNYTGVVPGGRKSNDAGRTLDLVQDIIFEVRDTDFTLTTVAVVALNITTETQTTDIEIFNAISPNPGDAQNAFFRINGIESYDTRKVTIFNRWGDIVFEMNNYNNTLPEKRFEGVSNNGKDLPSGTYFYKIEITGQTLTGYLSLKR